MAQAADPEVRAMGDVAAALNDLDDDAVARVIEWAAKRYGVRPGREQRRVTTNVDGWDETAGGEGSGSSNGFTHFADLLDATDAKTDQERALAGAYWVQAVEGNDTFQAQAVNTLLKDVGHPIGNITQALGGFQDTKPALVRQVAKAGRTRQARKTYKLTTAGIKAIQSAVEGEG